jgi:hypothetical protein
MRRLLLCACIAGTAAAADVQLPVPTRAELHFDGSRLLYQVALPAGSHRVLLPERCAAAVTVRGAAAWTQVRETRERPRPVLPDALPGLLAERNKLVAAERELAARAAELDAEQHDVQTLLPRLARGDKPDPQQWQRALDALLAAGAKLDADRLAQQRAREALIARAERLMPAPSQASEVLALGSDGPLLLDGDELSRRWQGLPVGVDQWRALAVSLPVAGNVTVVEERDDLRWSPAAVVGIAGGKATLERRCVIAKADALDFGMLPAIASTERMHPSLAVPDLRPVAVRAEPVVKSERKVISSGSSASDWNAEKYRAAVVPDKNGHASAAEGQVQAAEAAPAKPDADVEAGDRTLAGVEAESTTPTVATAARESAPPPPVESSLQPQEWDLGQVALPARVSSVAVAAASVEVAVANDEWALVPELSRVAIHRVDVRVDDHPLLAGPLTVVVDGRLIATQRCDGAAAGQTLHLRAGEDDTVYVDTDVAWEVDPAGQTPTHQRHGRDRWIWNLGAKPRSLRVYLTMPVSRAQELKVTVDGATTPGSEAVEPGVLHWTLDLPSGGPTRLGLGWQLDASGGLHL